MDSSIKVLTSDFDNLHIDCCSSLLLVGNCRWLFVGDNKLAASADKASYKPFVEHYKQRSADNMSWSDRLDNIGCSDSFDCLPIGIQHHC